MTKDIFELEQKAKVIRRDIIEMAYKSDIVTHEGPALSSVDFMTAIYFGFMKYDPQNPDWEERDRFILSKGHGYMALYAVLGEAGYFSKEEYPGVRHFGSMLQGHPTYHKTPGVEITTGSLGNGLGVGLGMAYYQKMKGKNTKVFVVVGDGECNEGAIWESVMAAPVLKTDNLIVVVDRNHFQSCGACHDILPMDDMGEKWKAFGWKVLEVNGHDMKDIVSKLEVATNYHGAPVVIIAETIKGKGISYMEHDNSFHNRKLTEAEYYQALAELEVE